VLLVREVLDHHGIRSELITHPDGESALKSLDLVSKGEEPCPDIVLLDLNLPKHDGRAILAKLRKTARCGAVPVIVITSSNAAADRKAAAELGADYYFCKPSDYDRFLELGDHIKRLTGR
jgi:two-component system response regulator